MAVVTAVGTVEEWEVAVMVELKPYCFRLFLPKPFLFEDEATLFSEDLFVGDALPGYVLRTPSGDRASVEAVGVWKDGYWTVVFKRSLRTESENDVQFTANTNYSFGISIFDNAGDEKHLKSHPLYLWLE